MVYFVGKGTIIMHMIAVSIVRLTSVFLAFALSAYFLELSWKPFSDLTVTHGHPMYHNIMAFLFASVGCLLLFSRAYAFLSIMTFILAVMLSYEALTFVRELRDIEYLAILLVILSTFLLITSKASIDDEG